MVHYTCDHCNRPLDPQRETRYIMRMEIYAAAGDDEEADGSAGGEEDRDHLQEIQEILEEAEQEPLSDDLYQELRFDLCDECRRRFLRNPMGRHAASPLGFSQN